MSNETAEELGAKMRKALADTVALSTVLSVFKEFYLAGKLDPILGELKQAVRARQAQQRTNVDTKES